MLQRRGLFRQAYEAPRCATSSGCDGPPACATGRPLIDPDRATRVFRRPEQEIDVSRAKLCNSSEGTTSTTSHGRRRAPVTRVRGMQVAMLAVAAAAIGAAGVARAGPPVPPPPTAGGGNGTTAPHTGGGAPLPRAYPRGRGHFAGRDEKAGGDHGSLGRAEHVDHRGDRPPWGGRPVSQRPDAGVGIGGSALRSSQVDSRSSRGRDTATRSLRRGATALHPSLARRWQAPATGHQGHGARGG